MYSNLKTKEFDKLHTLIKQTKIQRYKYTKCSNCEWRLCDVPFGLNTIVESYVEEMYSNKPYLVIKCCKCGEKQIIKLI